MKNKMCELCVCMLLIGLFFIGTLETVSADQESDYTYTVNLKGEANITGYTGAGGVITVPSMLSGYPTLVIGNNVFAYRDSLTSVAIPNGITAIGNNAFYYCTSLSSVIIPESVTTIGSSAFAYCSSLTSVTIPSSVTVIEDSAFYGCTHLTSVTIPDSVLVIGSNAFHSCINLTSVTIPDSVTIIGDSAFYGCTHLTSVNIPESVSTIEYAAFAGCSSLPSIIIGNNVATIGDSAFWGCSSLTSVTIGRRVTTIESYAFNKCASLTSVTFLGLAAPTSVSTLWMTGTPKELRGHAHINSNFPGPGEVWNGLTMGTVAENEQPIASFNWTPLNPVVNQQITFNALASIDPDGSLTLYEWDWNNDGIFEDVNTSSLAAHAWSQAGNYSVMLRVTDILGKTHTQTKTVAVRSINGDTDDKGTPGFECAIAFCALVFVLFYIRRGKKCN